MEFTTPTLLLITSVIAFIVIAIAWSIDHRKLLRQVKISTKAANKQKQRNKLLTTLMDDIDIPLWTKDSGGDIIFTNRHYNALLDTNQQSQNRELDSNIAKLTEQVIDTKLMQSTQMRIVHEGKAHLYKITEIPTNIGIVGFANDISLANDYEQNLKRYVSSQNQVMEASSAGIAIYSEDKKLRFYNQAFNNIWQLDEGWLKTNPTLAQVMEKLREARALPEQADFASFQQELDSMFTDNLTEPHQDFYQLPDDRSLRLMVFPHAFGGLLFVYEDLTSKLALERDFNTLQEVQFETLNNIKEGIAVFGEDKKLSYHNKAFEVFYNLNSEQLENMPHISELLKTLQDQHKDKNLNQRILDNVNNIVESTRQNYRTQIALNNGKVLRLNMVPLPSGEIMLGFNDITDSVNVERALREQNEALQEADNLKTDFLANISYELRSPLTNIIGYGEMLEQGIGGKLNKKQNDYVVDIKRASTRLKNLIDNLIDIGTIEAGHLELNYSKFDISKLMTDVLELVHDKIHRKKIKIQQAVTKFNINADHARLKQAIFNILNNAIHYTPHEGTIGLLVSCDTDNAIIQIRDDSNNNGTTKRTRLQAFTSDTLEMETDSVSIGLSVAKNLVELHGGKIEVDQDEEHGAVVTCIIPL